MVHVCTIFILVFLVRNVSFKFLVLYVILPLEQVRHYSITLIPVGLQDLIIELRVAVEFFYFRVDIGYVSVQG